MSEVVKWDGFPVFGRDRDAWHLLRFENEEHPTPMWWDWRLEAWFTDPSARGGMRAEAAHETGFSYLAGTVTPSDLNDAIAEAVAAERERIEEYVRERGAELNSAVLSTAFVCDVIAEEIRDGIDMNNDNAPEAIRSAAK